MNSISEVIRKAAIAHITSGRIGRLYCPDITFYDSVKFWEPAELLTGDWKADLMTVYAPDWWQNVKSMSKANTIYSFPLSAFNRGITEHQIHQWLDEQVNAIYRMNGQPSAPYISLMNRQNLCSSVIWGYFRDRVGVDVGFDRYTDGNLGITGLPRRMNAALYPVPEIEVVELLINHANRWCRAIDGSL